MTRLPVFTLLRRYAWAACLAPAMLASALSPSALAQIDDNDYRAVGGVSINADGLLDSARPEASGALSRLRREALRAVPGEMARKTDLRKVSLRRLEAAVDARLKSGKPLPEEIRHLAGLQQVRYVFVDPEQQDIVLAGPAEGWTVDARGFVIGRTSGRPVLLLDDLLVALRAASGPRPPSISCSIDPTSEGLLRLREHVARLRTIGNPRATAAGIENALGPQSITVEGVPADSHFARVLVAADYRMKRLAMDFDPSPVRGLPSFLGMVGAGPRGMSNMLPRWWLEPRYEAIVRDEAGLAWELQGASVQALTEEDYLSAQGQVEHTGKSNLIAKRWADAMTARFPDLAVADPVFGQLQNCMDLAVAATLIVRERLPEKAGCNLPTLLDRDALPVHHYHAPKQVASKASLARKKRNWIIAVSGGVMIAPEAHLKDLRTDAKLSSRRAEALDTAAPWWWD